MTLVITVGYGQPPGDGTPIADTPKDLDLDYVPPTIKCLELFFSSNNHAVINLDCPERTVFNIDILKNRCGCQNFNILIGGIKIKSVWSEELQNLRFTKNDLFNWTFLNEETGQSFLTVEIECVNTIFTPGGMGTTTETIRQRISYPIQLIKSGQEYTVEVKHAKGQPVGEFIPTEVLDETTSICCNQNLIKTFEESIVNTVGSSTTSNFTYQIDGQANFNINKIVPFVLKGGVTWKNDNAEYKKNENIIVTKATLPMKGSLNGCVQLGYQVIGEVYRYQKYRAICFLPDVPVGSPWDLVLPTSIQLNYYPVPALPGYECKPIVPTVDFRRNIFNRMACTGSLILDVADKDELYITWTNEDGQVIDSPNGSLSNVPIGQYTVTISNQCCEVFTKTYYNCESQTESPYTQKFNGDWCRTVTCYGEGCNEEYAECVTPDRIEDVFDQNQKKCIKEYYYNNELLGTTSVDATFETEWDDVWDRCQKSYFCNGSTVFTEDNYPDQSEWVYSNSENQCQRNVMCDGSWIYNVENSTPYEEWVLSGDQCQLNVRCNGITTYGVVYIYPDVTWSFDDVSNNCYSTLIYCDGNYTSGYLTNSPSSFGPWQLGNPWCYREVICPSSSGTHTDNGPFTYLDMGTSSTCNGNNTLWNRYCDGEYVDQICAEFAWFSGNPTESRRQFNANFRINTNFIHIEVTQSDSELFMYLNDVNGKLVGKQSIEKNQSSILVETQEFPSGIYFIVLTDGKKNVESSKFSIVK